MTTIVHCFLPYRDFIRIIKESIPVEELKWEVVEVSLNFVPSSMNKLMEYLFHLWKMFKLWCEGLKVQSAQGEVFDAVVGGQECVVDRALIRGQNPDKALSLSAVGAVVVSSSSPVKDLNDPVWQAYELRLKDAGDVILRSDGDKGFKHQILRSAQDDGSKEVKAPTVIPLSRHQPSVTVPAVPRVKEISQNRLEAIEDTEHMARKLEGLTADPNKAPPGEVISIFSAPKKPPVDPVNAKKSSLGPEILVLLPEIADDYFMLATGTASSPVDHDSTLPFEHRRAVFTWPIVGLVTEKTTEKTNGGQTGKGTSSGGNAAAGSMVKLIRSLRVQPKDFVKKAVRIIERRYRIGFRLTRILGELRAHIGSTSFIHGPPLLIHSSHEEFHAVDILCSAQDEGNSRAQGSRNFFVSNNFSILGAGSTGSGSIRVPSNQGSGFRAQGS
ncbi:MAG: hypothetical protein KAR31_02090, partial [Candidatus Omnitrophica bacterium]|nr:hypothetical protein [Candidatus Omnitrophota bacterium]